VLLDRSRAQHERGRDGRVRSALGHPRQHLALPGGQPLQRAVGPGPREQLRHHLRVERRAAVGHPPHGLQELADVHDAVFQQIADTAAAVGQQLGGIGRLHVLRDDQHTGAGHAATRFERGT